MIEISTYNINIKNMVDWMICSKCKGKGKVFDHAMGLLFPIVGYLFKTSEF